MGLGDHSVALLACRPAIGWYFFNLGMLTGSYVCTIPAIKVEHGLSNGSLGLVLFCCAFGSLASLTVVPRLNEHYGSGICTIVSSMITSISVPLLGMQSHVLLVLGMLSIGFWMGVVDVSVNAQAVLLEAASGEPQMGRQHAVYALGQLLGAALGGLSVQQALSPLLALGLVSGASLAVTTVAMVHLPLFTSMQERSLSDANADVALDEGTESSVGSLEGVSSRPMSTLALLQNRAFRELCLVGAVAYMGEGAVEDWTAVFFVEELGTSPLTGSIALSAFCMVVAGGRYASDSLVSRRGRGPLLRLAAALAGAGGALISLAPSCGHMATTVALGGLVVTGGGLAFTSPIISSVAGTFPGIPMAQSLSLVTSFTYTGYFVGPPLFGALAEAFGGVRWALMWNGLLLSCVGLLVGAIPEDKRPGAHAAR